MKRHPSPKRNRRKGRSPVRTPPSSREKSPDSTAAASRSPGTVRLQKLLAAAGLASRRSCEEWIRQGRVLVNGRKVTRLGVRADPRTDRIVVDGREISGDPESRVSYLLNKPRGVLSTLADPQGRPTVRELLQGVPERVFPVGRLDGDTEGLLILTNDGDLAHRVAHPSRGCPKIYRARVRGVLTERDRARLRRGVIRDGGRRFRPMGVRLIRAANHSWYELVLREGRKNQIRLLFRLLGHPVEKLRRVAIGPLRDRNLPVGAYRPLRPSEIRALLAATGTQRPPAKGVLRTVRKSPRTGSKTRKI